MSEKIDKLTPEQEAKIPEYLEMYKQIGLSTEPCDRAKAEEAITASYVFQKLPPPKFIWVESPFQGAKLAAQISKGSLDVTSKEIQEQASRASYGSFEAYWVCFYAFIAEQLPVKKDELIDIVKNIVKNTGVYWTFEKTVIVTEKPCAIRMKDGKLHNPDGLSLEYKNGDGIFAINGTRYKSLLEMTIDAAASKKD